MKKIVSGVAVSTVLLGLVALPAHATASTNNRATLQSGSAFVRSSWVQAGLKANGTFGTETPVPANFDSLFESESGGLGLINDFGEDGFTTDDNGDFFMPGSPYEAWGIKVDGNATAQNTDGDVDIAGSWTGSETTGDPSVTWTADSAWDHIEVSQNISAPVAGDHLFHITVTLHNTDSAAHTVYYSRQVDPDNNVDIGGDYSTFNRVIANSTSSQIVTGTAYDGAFSTIGYRSTDSTGVVRISDWSWPLQGWDEAANDGNGEAVTYTKAEMDAALTQMRSDYQVGYQDYLDSTIDIAFRKDVAAGASATIEFDYILDPRVVDVPEHALDLALDLAVGGDYADADTTLVGGGLKPNSTFTLEEHSTPRVIFTGTTLPNGNFYDETTLPSDCRPGSHTLILKGIAPDGSEVWDYVTYTVNDSCVVTAFNPYAGASGLNPDLAETGVEVSPYLMVSGFVAALGAAATVVARRRRNAA